MKLITIIILIALYAPLIAHSIRKYREFKEVK
jgi:multisubunit Na+/H+ antiporter MnhG subunit